MTSWMLLRERMKTYLATHPKTKNAVLVAAGAAAGYYAGPTGTAAVNEILPVVCSALGLC